MRLFGGRFTPIFEEIVALLPDKKMQRELVDAFAVVQLSSVLATIQPALHGLCMNVIPIA